MCGSSATNFGLWHLLRAAATAAVLDRRLAPNGAQGRDTCVCLDLVILDTPFDRHRLQVRRYAATCLQLRPFTAALATWEHSCSQPLLQSRQLVSPEWILFARSNRNYTALFVNKKRDGGQQVSMGLAKAFPHLKVVVNFPTTW